MKKFTLTKRVISLLTTLILVFVAVPVAFAAQDDNDIITRGELAKFIMEAFDVKYKSSMENHFSDISKEDDYYKAVIALVDAEIMSGYPDGTFKPKNIVRKAELACFFAFAQYGSQGKLSLAPTDEVTDLAKAHWAYSLVGFAIDEGIMPLDDGMFYPDKEARWCDIDYSVLSELLGKNIESPCPIEEADVQISTEQTIDVKQKGLSNFTEVRQYVADSFTDVKTTDWFSPFVEKVYNLNLMSGASATNFNAKGNVTIAETVAMAAKIHSIYNTGNTDCFEATTPWYQTYADYAIENKILSPGFNYTRPATRLEFVTILSCSLPDSVFKQINSIADDAIPDVPIASSCANHVYKFYRAGIIAGSDKYGTFNPKSNIQRSEVATIVTKLVKENERKTVKLEEKPIVEGMSNEDLAALLAQVNVFANEYIDFLNDHKRALEKMIFYNTPIAGYDDLVAAKSSMVEAIDALDKVIELCGNAKGTKVVKEYCIKCKECWLPVTRQSISRTDKSIISFTDLSSDDTGMTYFETYVIPIVTEWIEALKKLS